MTTSGDSEIEGDDKFVYPIHAVFSTGRTPTATYNARTGLGIERKLNMHLAASSNAVTVFGASKSGKTSLVEKLLPADRAVWIQGNSIQKIDDFWELIADRLNAVMSVTQETGEEATSSDAVKVEGGWRPVFQAGVQSTDQKGQSSGVSYTSKLRPEAQVLDLVEKIKLPVVIDDFHHVNADIRKEIARSIKSIIRHVCVVLIAIPSQAFDPVKEEIDLNGRIKPVAVPPWGSQELIEIANTGFNLLNVIDPNFLLASELANYSFGSPHIMQELCLTVLTRNFGITETTVPTEVSVPTDFTELLAEAAENSEPTFFKKLLEGKATKGKKRLPITLHSGEVTDSYGIVLRALRDMTPPMHHTLREIVAKVNGLTSDTVRQQSVTNALRGLDKIAGLNRGDSDAVVSYDDEVLYIEDSVFAFYLNHGPWAN